MRLEYDPEADAAYIQLVEEIPPAGIGKTVGCDPSQVGGMINLDFDSQGRLLGIEVLDASALLPDELLGRQRGEGTSSDG